jgi:hypothetical protein
MSRCVSRDFAEFPFTPVGTVVANWLPCHPEKTRGQVDDAEGASAGYAGLGERRTASTSSDVGSRVSERRLRAVPRP